MRTLLRSLLIALLIASLVEAPALAAPLTPLGSVLQAQHAHVGDTPAAAGTTLYTGDRLSTENGGTIQARMGDAQLFLQPNSVAQVADAPTGRTRLELLQGTAVFNAGAGFELWASQALFRNRGTQPALGQVSVLGPFEFEVTCRQGELEVTIGDEIHVVEAEKSYRVTVEPEQGQGSGRAPHPAGRSKWLSLPLLLLLIGAPTAMMIYLLTRSPSAP